MNWYKKAQSDEDEDDEDLLRDSFKELMEEEAKISGDPSSSKGGSVDSVVPPTPGVKRYFIIGTPSSPNDLASIEFMTMLDPADGSFHGFNSSNTVLAVSDDFNKVRALLSSMGYNIAIEEAVRQIKVYGKIKVVMKMKIKAPDGSDPKIWRHRFWTKDEKLTGAVMKPRSWGKK